MPPAPSVAPLSEHFQLSETDFHPVFGRFSRNGATDSASKHSDAPMNQDSAVPKPEKSAELSISGEDALRLQYGE